MSASVKAKTNTGSDFIKDERGESRQGSFELKNTLQQSNRMSLEGRVVKVYMKDLSSLASQRQVIGGVQITVLA